MDGSILFLGIMGCLSTLYIALGWALSKDMKTKSDFFLGGRKLGVFPITATLLATQIGGGMFLGTAENPFKGLLYILGMVLGFIILGFGLAEKYRSLHVDTLGGVLKKQYGHNALHTITDLLSIISIGGILLGQAIAAQSVIHHFTGVESTYLFPVFWFLMVAYTLLGGFKAVVITDLIQVAIVITVFTGLFFYMLWKSQIPIFSIEGFGNVKTLFHDANLSVAEMVRFITIPLLFSIITQDVAHRFFAAKDKATASISAVYSGVILLLFACVPFYFGLQAQLQNIPAEQGISPLLPLLQNYTNTFFFMLASCGLMSAIGSTIDSLLCAGSSIICNLTHELFETKLKDEVRLSQIITLVFGTVVLCASYFVPTNIIDILVGSYEVSVACLIVPVLFALLRKKEFLSPPSAFLSIMFGFLGFFLTRLYQHPLFTPWSFLVTLLISLTGHLIGDLAYFQRKGA